MFILKKYPEKYSVFYIFIRWLRKLRENMKWHKYNLILNFHVQKQISNDIGIAKHIVYNFKL